MSSLSDRETRLWNDYGHALETYRHFADIRFKLLAFVPTLSGAAVALLTKVKLDRWEEVALAGLGFLVTVGIVIYDQRNSQFYNGAISRAQHLENELRLPRFEYDRHRGLFGSRDDHRKQRMLLLPVGHGLALALVYGPVLGAWVFAAVRGAQSRSSVALAAGLGVATLAFFQLRWNDGFPKRLHAWMTKGLRRARWAVETLAVEPGEHVLEIGCGNGVAASLVCERLGDGKMLAIDRSALQIAWARRRNKVHVKEERLTLEAVDLADLDVGESRFDKVFAINVNVFWTGPATEELARVRRALLPDGRLFLFYDTPGPDQARAASERVRAALTSAAFVELETVTPSSTTFCCISRPA